MRAFLACVFATAMLARAGVPPRDASTGYPAHGPADAATIAADVVPSNLVSKMLSSEISKDYIVVEVAIYPDNGVPFDVKLADFALRVGQRVSRTDQPIDVWPWQERRTPSRTPPPNPKVDPQIVSDKVRRSALAEGKTKTATAGYLYFPQYMKRRKSDAVELTYARDEVSLNLVLGKP